MRVVILVEHIIQGDHVLVKKGSKTEPWRKYGASWWTEMNRNVFGFWPMNLKICGPKIRSSIVKVGWRF